MPPEAGPALAVRPRRIVCYAVNGAGLGHVSRLLHLARWMRHIVSFIDGRPPEIIFLTSTEATQLISDAGFAAFKLPSKGTARKTQLAVPEFRRLARQFVWQVLSDFAPDLLVVDTFAQGSLDELFPILDAPYARSLVLRRIKPSEAKRPIFQASYRFYHAVVFPHTRDEVLPLLAELPPGPEQTFVGPVFFDPPGPGERDAVREALRAELGLKNGIPLIYLSAGGGGDPHAEALLIELVRVASNALPAAALLVGAGPLYRGRRVFAPNVIWYSDPGISRLFPAVDAAISAAGYNSFHELAAAGVPTAFFGLEKIADDQDERVRRLEALGACLRLAYPLDSEAVATALLALLRPATASGLAESARKTVGTSQAAAGAAALLVPLFGDDAARAASVLSPQLIRAIESLGAQAVAFVADVLPRLLPAAGTNTHDRAVITRLMVHLSPLAQAEIEASLEARPDDLTRVTQAIIGLLTSLPDGIDPALVVSAFDAIYRRHVAASRPDEGTISLEVVAGVRRIFVLCDTAASYTADDRVSILKAFPAINDASLREFFGAFFGFLATGASRHEDAKTLCRRLQLAKATGQGLSLARLERIFEWVL